MGADWLLDSVTVLAAGASEPVVFPCGMWLSTTKEDKQVRACGLGLHFHCSAVIAIFLEIVFSPCTLSDFMKSFQIMRELAPKSTLPAALASRAVTTKYLLTLVTSDIKDASTSAHVFCTLYVKGFFSSLLQMANCLYSSFRFFSFFLYLAGFASAVTLAWCRCCSRATRAPSSSAGRRTSL